MELPRTTDAVFSHLGFFFAINIDPALFQVFTAAKTQQAWNAHIVHSFVRTHPQVVVIPTTTKNILLTFFYYDGFVDKKNYYQVRQQPFWWHL